MSNNWVGRPSRREGRNLYRTELNGLILKELIAQMTLEEKASLLSGGGQFYTKTVKRLGIPSMYLSDGPHGIRKQAGAADHLGLNASLPATCFPTAATVANSWDIELGEELGRYLGEEAVAQGVNVLLGPGLNMKRSPLCGRNFEYLSEDPYLAGKMAAAYIRGIQSQGVAACPKHFAVNNQELLRMHNDSIVDERTLREIYLTGFEIAVKEGNPLSLMSSYNRINGTYASENHRLLRSILVDEWGFKGFVVTDWGGSNDRVDGLKAGNHLEMPSTGGDSDREVVSAVKSRRISEALVDEMLDEYLQVLFATSIPENAPAFDREQHHQFAQKVAIKSIVLLKNNDALLPLNRGTKIAVIGDFAETPRYQGFGSSVVNPTKLDKPFDSLAAGSLNVIGYTTGYKRHGGKDEGLLKAAVDMAQRADAVLLYMGLDERSEAEGMDRKHMHINQNQIDVLNAIAAVNPKIVAVLSGGSPFEMPWLDKCKAVVHGYLCGQAGAGAMADILSGKANPSGKLAETWPISQEETPTFKYFPGVLKTTEYREGIYIGYRYYNTADVSVCFPFGYGLSYTTFEYSDFCVNDQEVSFVITNTGALAGSEIAQVYVGMKDSKIFRAARELKGFAKVYLEAGESKTVSIILDDKAFRYFNTETGQFEIEVGTYSIEVGASIQDIRLTSEIAVAGTNAPIPYDAEKLCSYYTEKVSNVSDSEFAALLGRPIPNSEWDRSKPLGRNDTFFQLSYAKGWVGRLVYLILTARKNKAEKKGKPDLNTLFQYNLPFRGIAKMMGGAVDMAMADAILEVFNGHFFKGFGHLISAWLRKGRAAKDTAMKLANAESPIHKKEAANEHA